ncbi:MAG TPA: hypothetical protein VMU51_05585 [Mycobacteriales bacterium]|nr:hypothetical protein [Mycobacteriales bacterium]
MVLKVVLIILGLIIAVSLIGAILTALKWLFIIAGIIFVLSLVGGWSRRSRNSS